MRADAFFAAARNLPFGTLADLTNGGGLVVVAPHPDDESLGCGGLLAEACASGTAVRLIVVSDGVGSHPRSRSWPAPRLRDLREAETVAAVAALGLPDDAVCFLRLPDRAVPTDGPAAQDARDAIIAACRDVAAGAVCVTWRHDPHCDHRAAAMLVEASREHVGPARLFAYPIWGWTLPPDSDVGPPPRGFQIDIARHRTKKMAAIAAHRSQTTDLIDDDPEGFRLTPEVLAHFDQTHELLLEI